MAADQSVAESAVVALAAALIRVGVITDEDIASAAEQLQGRGEHEEAVAHLLLVAVLQAQAPSQSDWQAQRARDRFRVVPSDPTDR